MALYELTAISEADGRTQEIASKPHETFDNADDAAAKAKYMNDFIASNRAFLQQMVGVIFGPGANEGFESDIIISRYSFRRIEEGE